MRTRRRERAGNVFIFFYNKVVKYLFERKVCRINDTMDYVFEDEKPDENPSSGTPRTHERVD